MKNCAVIRLCLPIIVAICGACLALAVTPVAVRAHGVLVRSTPPDGAELTEFPEAIELWFSESLAAQFSAAQLLDAGGKPVNAVNIQIDAATPERLTLLLPELAPGIYIVRYNVLSAIDGHFTRGLLVFGAGTPLDSAPVAGMDELPPAAEIVLRWLNLCGLAALAGAIIILQTILRGRREPQARHLGAQDVETVAQYRVLQWGVGCSIFSIAVGFGLFYWQAITLVDALPHVALLPDAAWQLLTQTRWGILWVSRQTLLLVIVGLAAVKVRGWRIAGSQQVWHSSLPRNQEVVPRAQEFWQLGIAVLALLVVQSLNSHAAGLKFDAGLAVIADTLHMVAASVWIGGLTALGVGLMSVAAPARAILIQHSWRHFSRLAVISVGVLTATGIYSMGRQVASFDALFVTGYGQALLAKMGIVLGVGAIGLINALMVNPMLARALVRWLRLPSGWLPLPRRHLPYLVIGEICLAALVLLATGVVTATPPPRGVQYTATAAGAATSLTQVVDDLTITLTAKPNRPGYNVFTIFAASSQRPPPAKVMRVILRFQHLEVETQRISAIAEEVEPGRFLVTGNYLTLPGLWRIEVVVRREGLPDRVADFRWAVLLPGQSDSVRFSTLPLERPLTMTAALLLLLILLVLAFGASTNSAVKRMRIWRN